MQHGTVLALAALLGGCGSDAPVGTEPTDASDASETLGDTTMGPDAIDAPSEASEGGEVGEGGVLPCGDKSCTASEWCVIPCCGSADGGPPCTPPPRYCAPAGCSGGGCDALCFGRSSVPSATSRTVTCLCP